jgi:hypothetical protein
MSTLNCIAITLGIINDYINDYETILQLKQVSKLFYNHAFNIEYDGSGRYISRIKDNIVSITLDMSFNYNQYLLKNKHCLTTLIDLDNNKYLTNKCLKQLTNLTELNIESDSITSYSIVTLTKLTKLTIVSENDMFQLDSIN